MASFRKRGKVWYFKFVDGNRCPSERKGCPDRRVTEEMARAAESEAAKVRAGLVDPGVKKRLDAGRRPITEHLDDFQAHLIAKGNTAKHADLFVGRARRVAALVAGGRLDEFELPRSSTRAERTRAESLLRKLVASARLTDLTPTAVQAALAALRTAGRSLATCNHHRAAVRGFTRWAWRDGRIFDDALAGVTGYNAKEDRRHDRRTVGLDKLRRLIEVAEKGPTYRRMTGPARALCYRLAVAIGLRFSEIGSIVPGSLDFEATPATVTIKAGYTKNGEPATLTLPADVAADLRAWVTGLSADSAVFPLPTRGADMLKIDLDAAGISYRDPGGLVFDFHSLRCQTATLADQAGVSPQVVQRMMRHSTLELTGRYTRPRSHDLDSATSSLPQGRRTLKC